MSSRFKDAKLEKPSTSKANLWQLKFGMRPPVLYAVPDPPKTSEDGTEGPRTYTIYRK